MAGAVLIPASATARPAAFIMRCMFPLPWFERDLIGS